MLNSPACRLYTCRIVENLNPTDPGSMTLIDQMSSNSPGLFPIHVLRDQSRR